MDTFLHRCSPCATCGYCSCGSAHTIALEFVRVCHCGYCSGCGRNRGKTVQLVHACEPVVSLPEDFFTGVLEEFKGR